ncbi:MAG: formylglycine-generating enzyme family protein, partial [Bacteroidales bacterium]|nr:formylglycine-generating enzyme family protein [Bacteroidales bacterium]
STGGEKQLTVRLVGYTDEVGSDYTEAAFGMELQMVAVHGGMFQMGITEDQGEWQNNYAAKPVHQVMLDGFYIGKFEVTQAQWEAVMETTIEQQRVKAGVSNKLWGAGDDYPMYYVSWEEAVSFCEKLSAQTGKRYRLPTEAEWEYAARGGQNPDGTMFAGSNNRDDVAWNHDNSGDMTHPVGQKQPNGLGLYDMSGNVWEWCSDWYKSGYYIESPSINPQGPSSKLLGHESVTDHVIRGGCKNDYDCRVGNRYNYFWLNGDAYIFGFRVVREP